MRWILTATDKWHAWPTGGRRSYCGRINVEHLRTNPAKAIHGGEMLPADGNVCVACLKKTGQRLGTPCGDVTTGAWISILNLRFRRSHINVADSLTLQLAMLLAEIGHPSSIEVQVLFEEIEMFLLKPIRIHRTICLPHLREVLAKLPLKTGALLRIATTIHEWRTITHRDLITDKFNPVRVVETILQIPSPTPYIQHLNSRGLTHLAAMFHPNTLERAKKEPTLRGLFAGSTDYWNNTAQQLNIISD